MGHPEHGTLTQPTLPHLECSYNRSPRMGARVSDNTGTAESGASLGRPWGLAGPRQGPCRHPQGGRCPHTELDTRRVLWGQHLPPSPQTHVHLEPQNVAFPGTGSMQQSWTQHGPQVQGQAPGAWHPQPGTSRPRQPHRGQGTARLARPWVPGKNKPCPHHDAGQGPGQHDPPASAPASHPGL